MFTEQMIAWFGHALTSLSSLVSVSVVPEKETQMWASSSVQWELFKKRNLVMRQI